MGNNDSEVITFLSAGTGHHPKHLSAYSFFEGVIREQRKDELPTVTHGPEASGGVHKQA